MPAGKRQDETAGSFGEPVPAKRRYDLIAEVPGVVLDRVRIADPEPKPPDGAVDAVESHREVVGGDPAAGRVRGLARAQLEPQVPVPQDSDVVEQRQ